MPAKTQVHKRQSLAERLKFLEIKVTNIESMLKQQDNQLAEFVGYPSSWDDSSIPSQEDIDNADDDFDLATEEGEDDTAWLVVCRARPTKKTGTKKPKPLYLRGDKWVLYNCDPTPYDSREAAEEDIDNMREENNIPNQRIYQSPKVEQDI